MDDLLQLQSATASQLSKAKSSVVAIEAALRKLSQFESCRGCLKQRRIHTHTYTHYTSLYIIYIYIQVKWDFEVLMQNLRNTKRPSSHQDSHCIAFGTDPFYAPGSDSPGSCEDSAWCARIFGFAALLFHQIILCLEVPKFTSLRQQCMNDDLQQLEERVLTLFAMQGPLKTCSRMKPKMSVHVVASALSRSNFSAQNLCKAFKGRDDNLEGHQLWQGQVKAETTSKSGLFCMLANVRYQFFWRVTKRSQNVASSPPGHHPSGAGMKSNKQLESQVASWIGVRSWNETIFGLYRLNLVNLFLSRFHSCLKES